jgi:hypothetical protein
MYIILTFMGKKCDVYHILTGKHGTKATFGTAGIKLSGPGTCTEL